MRLAAASRAHVDYRRDLLGLLAVVKVAEAELAVLSAAPCAQPPINERDKCVAASDGDEFRSPLRRVNQAIYLITTGAREAAFRNVKTISECLADELINAAKGSSNSYAIKKKDEIERVAKSNR